MIRTLFAAFALLSVALPSFAQVPDVKIVTATATATPAVVAPGGKGVWRVMLTVNPAFHINAHVPGDKLLIPTTFAVGKTPGVSFGPPQFPAPKTLRTPSSKRRLRVYVGASTIMIPFKVASTAHPGPLTLTGTVHYQGCTASACFPPDSADIKAQVTVK